MIRYSVTFNAQAETAAQDVFELVAAAGKNLRVAEIFLSQYSDFADAQDEILSILFMRGHTTAGSGGAAVTPRPLNRYAPAALFTAARNNDTVATSGTIHTLIADGFNVRAGWYWKAPPFDPEGGFQMQLPTSPYAGAALKMPDQIILGPSERGVLRITVPADSLTLNGTIFVDEFGPT